MQNTTIAATRSTGATAKVYVHQNCTCTRINGKQLPQDQVGTWEQAAEFAKANGYAVTFCAKSQRVEEAPAAPVQEDAPQGAAEFEIVLDNRDQYGRQRRVAVQQIVEALGGTVEVAGIKNRHRTGNDAFAVRVTEAPAALQGALDKLMQRIENGLAGVTQDAKEYGNAQGWDSNTRQKHWKNTARAFIVAQGTAVAAELV
jgi:hypothetical protein